jgi:hypothetical protein
MIIIVYTFTVVSYNLKIVSASYCLHLQYDDASHERKVLKTKQRRLQLAEMLKGNNGIADQPTS